jgi:hypothetical protein
MANTKKTLPIPIAAADLRRWSVRAEVDPRTILRVASGDPVRNMSTARARAVLEAAGYPLPDKSKGKAA